MTAEEVALEEFRDAVRGARAARRDASQGSRVALGIHASKLGAVRSIARIIRAIRAERGTEHGDTIAREFCESGPARAMTAEEVERRAEDIARACVRAIEGGSKFVLLVVEGAAPRGRKIRIERGTRAKCPMGEVVSFTASGTVAHFDAIEVLAWLAARGLVEVREGGKRWEVR